MITITTTCGNRLEHLAQTIWPLSEAAKGSYALTQLICVDYGPTVGVAEILEPIEAIERVEVKDNAWNFGKARNAALNAALGEIFINVDCDTFIDSKSIDWVAEWMRKQGSRSYVRSQCRRGVHGRFAFFTEELRELGGFHEEGIDGAEHVAGADIEDIYRKAENAGFSSARWPFPFDVIEHEIDRPASCEAGRRMQEMIQRG